VDDLLIAVLCNARNAMPTLLIDCPHTRRQFSTGIETSAESLHGSWKARLEVSCPHCQQTHRISVREAFLEAALRDAARV
jgi:hypothetical protein